VCSSITQYGSLLSILSRRPAIPLISQQSDLNRPTFRSALAHYPDSTVSSPHLFRKVAVRGICVE
jgi:hypothetical protein